MKSRIFNLDWDKYNHKDPEQRKCLSGALQFFLSVPNMFAPPEFAKIAEFEAQRRGYREAIAKIAEFTATGDFPPSILPLIEKFHVLTTFDNGYEQIFDARDFSGSARDGFTVSDVQSGLTFERIIVGQKLTVFPMSGTKTHCFFDFYGGALGWHRQLFDDKDWWTIEDNAIQFRNKAYASRASVYYQLIEAVQAVKSSCLALQDPGCTDCDAYAVAMAEALNTAAQTIALNCQNKGYGDLAGATFIVLTPIQMRGIVRRALSINQQAFEGSPRIIDFKFQQITSLMLASANLIWVILPKFKLKIGYRMDLSLFSDFDILSYTDTQAGWMRHGGCVGDTDQLECIDGTKPSGVPGF